MVDLKFTCNLHCLQFVSISLEKILENSHSIRLRDPFKKGMGLCHFCEFVYHYKDINHLVRRLKFAINP